MFLAVNRKVGDLSPPSRIWEERPRDLLLKIQLLETGAHMGFHDLQLTQWQLVFGLLLLLCTTEPFITHSKFI